jgi:hypothetical protein
MPDADVTDKRRLFIWSRYELIGDMAHGSARFEPQLRGPTTLNDREAQLQGSVPTTRAERQVKKQARLHQICVCLTPCITRQLTVEKTTNKCTVIVYLFLKCIYLFIYLSHRHVSAIP